MKIFLDFCLILKKIKSFDDESLESCCIDLEHVLKYYMFSNIDGLDLLSELNVLKEVYILKEIFHLILILL